MTVAVYPSSRQEKAARKSGFSLAKKARLEPQKPAERPLDKKRIEARSKPCNSEFSRLFSAISVKTGEIFDINCRSWRCPRHRFQWGQKWATCVGEMCRENEPTLLINLTTAEFIGHEEIKLAMKFFMRRFRDYFGPTEYVKAVEYNKRKTQPHFHLILRCEELNLGKMPRFFGSKRGKKLSWPYSIYTVIKYFWEEALNYAAPWARSTTVVWCQPPANAAAASRYAVNYITGANSKDEEPDDTWHGRKLSYSRAFFDLQPAVIWQMYLDFKFGPKDEEDKFFWQLKPIEEQTPGDNAFKFAACEIMRTRQLQATYYRTFGHFPPVKVQKELTAGVYYEIEEGGQEYFIPELDL